MLALGLLVVSALVVSVGQAPFFPPPVTPPEVVPIVVDPPLPRPDPLCLDLSQATLSQAPGASEGIGAWLIPVQGLSDILNAPPSRDTAIGIMIVGPEVGILYFRVVGGIAFLVADRWKKEKIYRYEGAVAFLIAAHWKKEKVYAREVRWVLMGPGVAGETRLDFIYMRPPPPPPELWRPAGIKFEHKPDRTWIVTIIW